MILSLLALGCDPIVDEPGGLPLPHGSGESGDDTGVEPEPDTGDTGDTGGDSPAFEPAAGAELIVDGLVGDWAGTATATADVDEDGAADLVIGLPARGGAAGGVALLLGPVASGSVADADALWLGERGDAYAGAEVAAWPGGFAVGAFWDEEGGAWAGSATVLPPSGSGDLGEGVARLLGSAGDHVGTALAWSSDGLWVGAYGCSIGASDAGAAWLLSSDSTGRLGTEDAVAALVGTVASGGLGVSLATGDLTGEGDSDMLVGASAGAPDVAGAGAVYLFAGPFDGTREDPDAVLQGEPWDAAGSSLAVADVDGDGIDDLAVGAPDSDRAYVLRGPLRDGELAEADLVLRGGASGDSFGFAVALAPGGRVAVGASRARDSGVAYLFAWSGGGGQAVDEAERAWVGETSGDRFGLHVDFGDPLDLDAPQLLVGARAALEDAGRVYGWPVGPE